MTTASNEHVADRSGWPAGPWDQEPDRVEWRHAGLPCLILRNQIGALCGYVAVPPGHPDHGSHYREIDVHAHGGLTYSACCADRICHVPREGEPDDVWWLGFDCAHAGDLSPGMLGSFLAFSERPPPAFLGTYRDLAYVTAEVNELAEQLRARAS